MATPHVEDKTRAVGDGAPQGTDHLENGHQLENIVTNDAAKKDTSFQPPELVRNMTAEERKEAEKRLVRKIDLRLLPMIILMYILNYIDR